MGNSLTKTRLRLARIDPLSAVATMFLLSLLLGVANIIAVILIWLVARVTGSLEALSGLFSELFGVGAAALDVTALLSLPRVIGIALVFSIFQVVVVTVISGVVAVLYNGIASLVGGFEVTLADDVDE